MIGMVLVTHGRLATEFVAALEHVVGPQQRIAAVCIGPDDDMEQRRREILESVAQVDEGDDRRARHDHFARLCRPRGHRAGKRRDHLQVLSIRPRFYELGAGALGVRLRGRDVGLRLEDLSLHSGGL